MTPARNRARYLAPIALAAAIVATYVVVQGSTGGGSSTVHGKVARHRPSRPAPRKPTPPPTQFYVVKAGDTLSGISARTGVSLPTLQQLNPNVNPGALQTGQRLRLRQ